MTPGAVIAVVVWILASWGFSTYIANFGNYGATYGSLGGIVILLLYFFISAGVFLFGAEINATISPPIRHRRAMGRVSHRVRTACSPRSRSTTMHVVDDLVDALGAATLRVRVAGSGRALKPG